MTPTTDDEWREYFAITVDKPAHPLFDLLDEYLPDDGGRAIDLGCGPGRGTLRLLARGLQVTAVDQAPEALAMVRERAPADAPLELVEASMDAVPLDRYDVAVGCFSVFFLSPDRFEAFWPRLVAAIRPGGLWAGEFLGVNDTWRDECTTHTRAQIDRLLDGFEVLHLGEEEFDGATALNTPKHWHLFHTIARRRS